MNKSSDEPTLPVAAGSTPLRVGELPRTARYTSMGEIAAGGMGHIHRVLDHQLDRVSAMKVLDERIAAMPVERQRFVDEARITGRLDHPNIVPVHELSEAIPGEPPRFVMKLVEGATLSDELERAREGAHGFDWMPRFLRIFLKVCDGVAFAHSRGVVHRDLKPANILIGTFGEVYVMDWGLARVLRPEAFAHGVDSPRSDHGRVVDPDGMAVGTLQYLSPEQARGENALVDERTDVFLLGGVLYYILTGQAPYANLEPPQAISAAQKRNLRSPEIVDPSGLHPQICQITMKALALDPKDRYQSVAELQAAVDRFLHGGLYLPHRSFPRGATIVAEGAIGAEAFIIVRGTCEAYKLVDGSRVSLRRMGPGDVFGEMAVLSSKPRSASVEALEELTVMVVTAEILAKELGISAWMGGFVMTLAERFREADERLTQLESGMLEDA